MAKSEFNLEPLRTDFDPHQDMLRGFDLALSQVPEVDYSEFTTPADPVDWMEAHFRIPETDDKRLRLAPYQKRMIREMLSTDENGNFKYSVILWSDIKKSIKSTITAAVALWRAFQVDWGQIVLVANDLKQANSRVGYYARRAIQLHPGLRAICQVIQTEIRFPNHTIIESIPIDPSGEAGGNADMVVFSELWGAHQAAQKRMWTEATLSPTKFGRSFRMIETYAGFNGESDLLENLYEQGITNGAPFDWCKEFDPPLAAYYNIPARMIAMWNQVPRLPWQRNRW